MQADCCILLPVSGLLLKLKAEKISTCFLESMEETTLPKCQVSSFFNHNAEVRSLGFMRSYSALRFPSLHSELKLLFRQWVSAGPETYGSPKDMWQSGVEDVWMLQLSCSCFYRKKKSYPTNLILFGFIWVFPPVRWDCFFWWKTLCLKPGSNLTSCLAPPVLMPPLSPNLSCILCPFLQTFSRWFQDPAAVMCHQEMSCSLGCFSAPVALLKVICLHIDLSLSRKCSDTFGLELCFLLQPCCLLCSAASQAAISLCPLLYPEGLICPCYYSFFHHALPAFSAPCIKLSHLPALSLASNPH